MVSYRYLLFSHSPTNSRPILKIILISVSQPLKLPSSCQVYLQTSGIHILSSLTVHNNTLYFTALMTLGTLYR